MNQKWEYNTWVLDVDKPSATEVEAKLDDILNNLGRAGWELVSAWNGIFIFKRLVQPKPLSAARVNLPIGGG